MLSKWQGRIGIDWRAKESASTYMCLDLLALQAYNMLWLHVLVLLCKSAAR